MAEEPTPKILKWGKLRPERVISAPMGHAKQIVFRYNGDPKTEESDLDMDGDKPVPEQGSIIDRRGERWKVVQVNLERSAAEPFAVPTYRIFLTNEL